MIGTHPAGRAQPEFLAPYIACIIVAAGLLVQFGYHLVGFSRRGLRSHETLLAVVVLVFAFGWVEPAGCHLRSRGRFRPDISARFRYWSAAA